MHIQKLNLPTYIQYYYAMFVSLTDSDLINYRLNYPLAPINRQELC